MVQARWGHLNDRESWLTRCQAFALDAQFVIIQSARSWAGLLVKFNGSAGIWRRACIDDAGGWQSDTLTEDLDLSLRAQMHGWRFLFVPQVVVPAELPSHLAAYKRQQHRWAHGSTQVLRKLGARLLASPLPLAARLDGLLQVWAYVNHVIVAALLLFWLPLLLLAGVRPPSVPWVLPLALAGPLILGLAQWAAGYPDWKRRILYLPLLFLMGVGLGLNNSAAVVAALLRRSLPFVRTPKGQGLYRPRAARHARYALPTDWTLWAELGLASFALFAAREMLAFDAWLALPLVYLGGCYGFVAGWGFLETGFNRFRSRRS
jgi:cellulose synthase/poly-beta-1,6-N-acetylglucosamine synthase-like glycosyltransferase